MDDLVTPLSENQKRQIEELAGYGASEEDIAGELRIPLKHLQENHRDQITYGKAKGRNDVLKAFYNHVLSGTHVTSLSVWVKSQCGWRDTGIPNAASPAQFNIRILTKQELPCPTNP